MTNDIRVYVLKLQLDLAFELSVIEVDASVSRARIQRMHKQFIVVELEPTGFWIAVQENRSARVTSFWHDFRVLVLEPPSS